MTSKCRQILILAIVLFFPLISQAGEPQGKRPEMPTAKADVFIIEHAKNLAINLTYPAQINAFEKVTIVARASGILEKKYFTEGQAVSKGDLLYSIEDDIYQARVNVAKASVKISQAALDNATRSWKRIKNLFKSKTVTEDQRDSALASYEQALASLALAKAQLKQAEIDFNYTKVTTPISGVVGLKQVDVGNFVSAMPPTKLIEITQNNKVYVDFSMPFRDYANIKNKSWMLPKNNKITVALEIDNKLSDKAGIVDFIDVNIDKSTSTVKMRAVVDNPDGGLMAGHFVRVILNNIVQSSVITVPQKAILQNPRGTIVFVATHGHVGVKPVVLGNEVGDKYVVIGGPLASGDQVIINNFFRLKPGAAVQIDKVINAEDK